jgi:filamentous hemagglutinin family protein
MPIPRMVEMARSGFAPAAALALGSVSLLSSAAQLPVPCAAGACGVTGPATWVTSGSAQLVQAGNVLTINQSSSSVILNWQSFNISSDGTVTFKQPDAASVALNQIFQADPSKILGALNANGSIYLINQNGIVFGNGAQVNTGSLIASSLNITPAALTGILNAAQQQKPAFASFVDANGQPLPSGAVQVAAGATIKAPNGEILLLAPEVTNQGTLQANGGQVILAAGDSVYLAPSTDPNLRGLLVEVGHGGKVTNAAASTPGGTDYGQISANQGDVTLVGLMVNQSGRISATTSVRQNGSIHLMAEDGGFVKPPTVQGGAPTLGALNSGTLTLGAESHTDVLLDLADTGTAVDATAQPKSQVVLSGLQVELKGGSEITATSGSVSVTASATPGQSPQSYGEQDGPGRLVIDPNASIDVSGANIELPMESNVIAVQLRGTELADSPLQRNGPLRGATVDIDIRQSGVLGGVAWQGSPIGNLSGYIATIAKDVGQRNLTGGSITLNSDGAVIVAPQATLNISGGSTTFLPGYINTTKVLGSNGKVYDISQADPNQTYTGIVSGYTVSNSKWGTTQTFPTYSADPRGTFEAGYVQGNDAGQLSIAAPHVVLDSNVQANTVVGPFQRQMPGNFDPTAALYRPVNQMPLGGTLTLGVPGGGVPGNNYVLPDVIFASGGVLNTLTGPGGGAFDPLNDPLPAALDTVRLRPDLFGANGITQLQLFANGIVTVPQNTTLQMPVAGKLAITAGVIDFLGSIKAPDGSVSLISTPTQTLLLGAPSPAPAPGLTLGANSTIDVSGEWVNDLPARAEVSGTAPLATAGGSVTLSGAGGAFLDLMTGSLIDASGGAQRTAAGQIVGGTAGNISISVAATPNASPVPIALGSTLRAYALQHGGSLSISANEICIAATNCANGTADTLWIAPQIFSGDGFGSVALTADLYGLEVLPGTQIAPREVNFMLSSNAFGATTGTPLASIASLGLLPDISRAPVNVALNKKTLAAPSFSFDHSTYDAAGFLSIGQGASIALDARGSLTLTSDTSIDINGKLSAPAGSISVSTTNGLPLSEFIPSQGIWLLDGAQLSTQGVSLLQVDNVGRTTGAVLGGGSISITANRGYLVTDPLSTIDASGTAARINIAQDVAVGGVVSNVATLVGSNGGTISLTAAEGMLLNGSASAFAGKAPGTVGGALNVTIDGNLHGTEPGGSPIYPFSPRNIIISNGSPIIVAPQYAVPDQYSGEAFVPDLLLQGGGFSAVALSAKNLFDALGPNATASPVSTASIIFPESTSLLLPASIRLDAPSLVSEAGAQIQLSAAYVGLGYDDAGPGAQVGATSSSGTGTLQVQAGLIDFFGSLGLGGISTTRLNSTGDIRFIGVQSSGQTAISGTLQAQGSLTFQANQLYPTTLSQFTVVDTGAAVNTIAVLPGASGAPVLSAGGSLTLQADTIQQGGVLRAPFGQIVLQAGDISLEPGSLTSTSGAGQLIPFGLTQAGADWVYALPGGQFKVYTQSGPPAKSIQLQGDSITVDKGATVDLSGGGDLQASEFVPGVGGTIDVLSNTVNPSQFAIVPIFSGSFAPYDTQSQVGFAYSAVGRVILDGGAGVPAGEYAILPAAYALLPGAYLVKPVAGFANITPGQVFNQTDGSAIIAGQFIQAGSTTASPLTQGFDVRPGTAVQNLAQYNLTSADTFFTNLANAATSAVAGSSTAPTPRLPVDAGQLQFLAGQQLQFLGSLAVAPASGGRGAEVDISASQIEITNGSGSAATGTVALNAAQLNSLGAASLLLGGTRTEAGGASNIATTATTLTVDSGVTLSGTEILLAAQDQVTLDAGAKLSASGTLVSAPTEYDLIGAGALLRVSTGALAPVARGQLDGSSGGLTVAQGATIQATGSATLEASGQMLSQATYDLSGGALSFTAPRIALSAEGSSGAGSGTSSLQLSTTQLSSLNLSALDLASGSTIDVFGNNRLIAPGSVSLSTGVLEAMTRDASLLLSGNKITLQGTAAAPMAGSPSTSNGTLALQADQLLLTGGNLWLLGFAAETLGGAGNIRANGSGSMLADQSLTLNTAQLSTAPGASFQFTSANSLNILGALAPSNSVAAAPGAGGAITLAAANISVDTAVNLPSGVFRASAQGASASDGVMLGASAVINVAGFAETFDTLQVVGPGGRVDLSSAAGGITMATGSKIDLSAGGPGGAAGQLSFSVPNGQIDLRGALLANGGSGATAGQFSVDAATLPDLAVLNANLNAGGFGGLRNFHQRGPGDIVISASTDVNAAAVMISDDGGSVDVLGRINASGVGGGTVTLAARNAIDIEGSVLASASGAGDSGGTLSLASNSGAVRIGSGAIIDLSGGAGAPGGTLSLRVPRAALANLTAGGPPTVSLGGTIHGVQQVSAEGVAIYSVAGNTISAGDVIADPSNPIYSDAANFMLNAAGIATALKGGSNLNVSVLPGIEIDSAGDLTLGSAWDLSSWRFNGAPGILTLRAAGNLLVQQSLSDGFSGVSGPSAFVLPTVADQSWSYRLVAGADLTASNVMTVQSPSSLAPGSGNLEIASGVIDNGTRSPPNPVMIRTGTGNIDIAAAGDLAFGNRASVIYTAGQNSNAGIALSQLANLAYPTAGGNISVNVGGDILGAPTNQLVTSWLWRSGQIAGTLSAAAATGWTDNYQWFEENIGALAGGNVNIKAGGNIAELSVAIPTIGVQTGGTGISESVVQVTGGGNLTVESGGDITGGSYFVGRGTGQLKSWGSVGANTSQTGNATGFAPVLALGDASLSVAARTGLALEGIVNPFLLPQATVQPTSSRTLSAFSTYSDSSAVNLVSNAGDISLLDQPQLGLEQELNSMPALVLQSAFQAYPGNLNAAALSGNLNFEGNPVALWPSRSGNLNLLAAKSVNNVDLIMSGLDPSSAPNPAEPVNTSRLLTFFGQQLLVPPAPGTAYTPIHSAAFPGNAADDPNPIRIVAATGDISNASLDYLSKPIHLVAGNDISGLTLRATNLSSTDLSVISAGHDLLYAFPRDPTSGVLQVAGSGIVIEGPGSLLIEAGHNINLGTAGGVTTVGNLYNPSIPPGGADVSVLTGATVANADLSAFITQYLVNSDNYDSLLMNYLQGRVDQPLKTKAQALTAFESLSLDQQFELSQQILFNEIRTGGRAAAAAGPTHGDYTRSFTALETLFPKSTTSDAPSVYPGSLSLYFSQIYTLDGGSISMIAPGGGVNVGLSTPPASFGISKAPSQLGIVAQGTGDINSVSSGDFLVNQSRVFAANGGDILVWSTDGNIDAGRGAKTAISAPAPTITFTAQGQIQTTFPAALVGSGIQALATSEGATPGDVDLYAPRGVVNASDAGIVAGNLTIGATAVLGRDNITVSGISVGVPVDASGLGANLASSSSVGSSATSAAALAVDAGTKAEAATPLAQGALAFLDVFVLGLGEEVCKQDDVDCLKRQKTK